MWFIKPQDSILDVLSKLASVLSLLIAIGTVSVAVYTYIYTVKPVFDKHIMDVKLVELEEDIIKAQVENKKLVSEKAGLFTDLKKLNRQLQTKANELKQIEDRLDTAEYLLVQTDIIHFLNTLGYSKLDKMSPERLYLLVKSAIRSFKVSAADPYMKEAKIFIEEYLLTIEPDQYKRYGAVKYYLDVYYGRRKRVSSNPQTN